MANEHNTMPYNRDAEMALLGCFLIDTEIAAEMIDKVSAEDFYVEAHKYIVAAMKKAFVDRKPIDIVTVADELDGEGNLDKVGGYAYLNDLAQVTPSAANYQSYYDIVSRDGTNRRLIRAARKIIEFDEWRGGAKRPCFRGKIHLRHLARDGYFLVERYGGRGYRRRSSP